MSSPVVSLIDDSTHSQADVLVAQGFNCFRFKTCVQRKNVEVLWAADGFANGTQRASSSGIPLLFPFPGRIQGTEFQWERSVYSLQAGDGRGNAIHGFVHTRPWRVLDQSPNHVTGQFQSSVDDPTLLKCWPSDFCLTATYRLEGNQLAADFTMANPGDTTLPCGFGTHPYFRVPLTSAGAPEDCRLVLPLRSRWMLNQMIPTGEREKLTDAEQLQRGVALGERQLDDVFTDLVSHDQLTTARIEDPRSGLATEIEFTTPFRECVVYTPDHRQAVCIEPYTCVPNPFRLEQSGVDAGLLRLGPRESVKARVVIRVVPLPSNATVL